MKKYIFLFFVMACLFNLGVYAQPQDSNPVNKSIQFTSLFNASMKDSVACYRIPALVTAKNGDLIAAIDERVPSCGDLKWSKDINIVLRRSKDNGKTWSDIETIVDLPWGESASDPSMIVEQQTGDIILFYNYMNLDKAPNVYYLHMIRSSNHGKTWSEPIDITSQIAKPEWHNHFKFITSGRGFQTKSGQLVHCMVNLDQGMHLFASDDLGKSWYLIDRPITPANEAKFVELDDFTWMVNARVNDKKGHRYVHLSKDQGKTWQSMPETQLTGPSCNASILRYSAKHLGDDKNRLIFANANHSKERTNMTVRISYDEGKTWSNGKTIYTGKSAYASLTKLSNGEIGLFFEKDDYQDNVFVRFSLDWLTDGQDTLVINND